tara:strand:- start:2173 stop:3342 length:1170 start_codon:yes stop_codon:yes gene_type:complete
MFGVIALFTALLSIAISRPPTINFSQYEGFQKHFSVFPRHASEATNQERMLLERYRPRLFIGTGQEGPISFYDDYIAHGTLYNMRGDIIGHEPNRALLNTYKNDSRVVFVHMPSIRTTNPVVFARIDHADVPGADVFTFLSYHFVFRQSGVPLGMPHWILNVTSWFIDLRDWHQLDHYTMARVVLDRASNPVAVVLQQHNYVRSYILGRDMPFPSDDRITLDAALHSNELYPHLFGRHLRRAVPFMTSKNLSYLVTGKHAPWISTNDVTDPAHEVAYRLDFLPHTDAFYSFQGYLGKRRWFSGRSGPPGADYNTLPRFKPLAIELAAFNWREGNYKHMQHLINFIEHPSRQQEIFTTLTTQFRTDIACQLRKDHVDCRNHIVTPENSKK